MVTIQYLLLASKGRFRFDKVSSLRYYFERRDTTRGETLFMTPAVLHRRSHAVQPPPARSHPTPARPQVRQFAERY